MGGFVNILATLTNIVYLRMFHHCRLPRESPEDLLSHDEDNYDILEGLDTYTHKFCGCDPEIGLVCSYKKYQECKTATRGKPLTCTLQTSNRRKRDIRKLQERALLVKRVDRSQVALL